MCWARASLIVVSVVACAQAASAPRAVAGPHDALITKHAAANAVPESLVRRVIRIESRGNPRVVSKGNFGLMQIRLGTARAMGYSGTAEGLLDADTNMTYAVKYLAGAYRAAGCNENRAVSYYQRGYYGKARAKCAAPVATVQVAKAETNARGEPTADRRETVASSSSRPADVLKPKVVHTEFITTAAAAQVPPRPVAKFEPARISAEPVAMPEAAAAPEPPPMRPVRSAELNMIPPPPAAPPSQVPTRGQMVASLEAGPVPLPPARPAAKPAAEQAKPVHRTRHRHARAHKKDDAPVGLAALWKKITTPDKKSRRR